MPDSAPALRDRLLDFELELNSLTSERVVARDWGRAFLSPSLPLVWDANWVLIEQAGLDAEQVEAIADEALADFDHRTVAFYGEAEGERLAPELAELPGWEVERAIYMAMPAGVEGEAAVEVVERRFAECEDLRLKLILDGLSPELPKLGETAAQLLEWNRRFATATGDRWFLAPAELPRSGCCLFLRDGIGQIEDVGTLSEARERGFAKAAVTAAVRAARRGGAETVFLIADAADWPQLMYARLGFEPVGELTILRRKPS